MDRPDAQELRREPQRVAQMFDRIAARYDLMNRLMTAGRDRRWRRLAAAQARLLPGDQALDVCCGTGDLTLDLAAAAADVTVVGLDLSERMLEQARGKLVGTAWRPARDTRGTASGRDRPSAAGRGDRRRGAAAGLAGRITFVSGNALQLPFAADRFAAVTAAFGVRNLHDLPAAFAGMLRVTRPGGRLVCLEITTPPPGVGRRFHAFWFDRCVPLLGRLIAGDSFAYSYLPASVRVFPHADGLAQLLWDAGWRGIRYRRLGLGIVALHVAEKPCSGRDESVAAHDPATSADPSGDGRHVGVAGPSGAARSFGVADLSDRDRGERP